jgi:hypothetical protein
VLAASIFKACLLTHRPDDGGSKHLWNIGKLLPDYTAQQRRRHPSSYPQRLTSSATPPTWAQCTYISGSVPRFLSTLRIWQLLMLVRFEVLTAVKMTMLFFWFMTPSSSQKMDTLCLSETLVYAYEFPRRRNAEEQHRHLYLMLICFTRREICSSLTVIALPICWSLYGDYFLYYVDCRYRKSQKITTLKTIVL